MSIIDSLKRLERVGSENSKTTQKLIAAATELSELIVKYFRGEDCTVVENDDFRYEIDGGRLINFDRFHWAHPDRQLPIGTAEAGNAVDQSRNDALVFSRDIANGLLDQVIATLEKRTAENEQGLPALEDALAKLKGASKA